MFFDDLSFTSASKPILDLSPLVEIILSIPANAPPQINKIFVVSICKKSC